MFAFISHPECMDHDAGFFHPDIAERLSAINNQMIASGLDFVIRHYDAPLVNRQHLALVHGPENLERIYAIDASRKSVEIDGDTVMSKGTLKAAERAAGAGVLGVDLIMRKEAFSAFCAIRPPGHHAERDRPMGFCLFNNIAVAAAYAMKAYKLKRVAIVDFDVHHGNGTEDIFRNEPRVLFCSSFQHPFYPFTGHASDTSNLIDVPLPSGTTGPEFRTAITEHWLPALNRFKPEFLFISAGFDAHISDDMSGLKLGEGDYGWLTEQLLTVAQTHANGRILSMLEGGYDPGALARSVVAHVKALIG